MPHQWASLPDRKALPIGSLQPCHGDGLHSQTEMSNPHALPSEYMAVPITRLAISGISRRSAATCLLALQNAAFAWNPDWLRTASELRGISDAAKAYRRSHGDWPRDDTQSRWFEKLRNDNWLVPASEDGEPWNGPLDSWGNTIEYVPPPANDTAAPLIRSWGEDGHNNLGAGDDLTAGREVNIGSYGRQPPGLAANLAVASIFVLVIVLAIWFRRIARLSPWMAVLSVLWIGTTAVLVSELMWPRNRSHGSLAFEIRRLGGTMQMIGLLGIPSLLMLRVASSLMQPSSEKPGQCPNCQYDTTGIPTSRCPECGHPQASSVDPPPAENP